MLTTLVFFVALICSFLTIINTINSSQSNYSNYNTAFVLSIITALFWSWLFYLLH